ncbi:FAD:protein FMN transferase [Thalassotalea sp. PLHSN55]|uniref:FAD:protein FMN transferase n=1 Tax=Thalassotalea sp. PLHSN55 TaxID=3435888 RepID=UPI003F83E537
MIFMMLRAFSYVVFLLLLTGCFPSSDGAKQEVLLQGRTMGTTYNIKVVVPKDRDTNALKLAVDELLKEVNQQMSTYIPSSELSQFNQSTSLAPIDISSGLERVLAEALRLGEISAGKLDVTVGPLVNLWGFGPEYRPETVPSEQALIDARSKVGLKHILLNQGQLSKTNPQTYVDLSTIAKGYGVDVVAELIEQNGINNYLVEIGGEMRLKGFKATGELWHVAIEKPITSERSVHQIIIPKDNAVATSGDYRNYYEADGMRYSHIIDPDTGKPINHKLVSVTVIHPSSMTADGLSTAMMVMGEEKALAFAEQHQVAAYIIAKTDTGFEEIVSQHFVQYLK